MERKRHGRFRHSFNPRRGNHYHLFNLYDELSKATVKLISRSTNSPRFHFKTLLYRYFAYYIVSYRLKNLQY